MAASNKDFQTHSASKSTVFIDTSEEAVTAKNYLYAKANYYSSVAYNFIFLGMTSLRYLSDSLLTKSFCFGTPIYPLIPHVRSKHFYGHLGLVGENPKIFTKAALQTSAGIATCWAGPFPIIYVTSNATRLNLVRESHVGIVNEKAWKFLHWLSGGNKVMTNFPDFMPIDSKIYAAQRQFLMNRFHGGAVFRLPDAVQATTSFLEKYSQEQGESMIPLRDFVTALVLHTSSYMLGLSKYPLDRQYLQRPEYRTMINRVARYGVAERAEPEFEKILYQFFLEAFYNNFEQISAETTDTNLIRNIFHSLKEPFPESPQAFAKLPTRLKYKIAMNFSATGLGGMVHSTISTLDWAIARLLNEPAKVQQFKDLMKEYKHVNLKFEEIFDKNGELFPICEWVLYNVFLYPPFSHEFFLNSQSFEAKLADDSRIKIPRMSLTVVNYTQCNLSNTQITDLKTFSNSLKEESTVGKFIADKNVASFGGSLISSGNGDTRKCPAAKTSLYEQMIILAILFRDYSLEPTNLKELVCEVDQVSIPLRDRVHSGNIVLKKLELTKTLTPESSINILESKEEKSVTSSIGLFKVTTPGLKKDDIKDMGYHLPCSIL